MVRTFKIITLVATLEEDTVDLYKDHDSGSIGVENARIKCWKHRDPVELATKPFGQGVSVTPIQLSFL